MLTLGHGIKVWVATQALDMRKSFDRLAEIVTAEWKKDVYSGALFVFFNRYATRVKILYWDRNGYCLWQKRLEKGRFRLPCVKQACYSLSGSDLNCLLEGIDLTDHHRLTPL